MGFLNDIKKTIKDFKEAYGAVKKNAVQIEGALSETTESLEGLVGVLQTTLDRTDKLIEGVVNDPSYQKHRDEISKLAQESVGILDGGYAVISGLKKFTTTIEDIASQIQKESQPVTLVVPIAVQKPVEQVIEEKQAKTETLKPRTQKGRAKKHKQKDFSEIVEHKISEGYKSSIKFFNNSPNLRKVAIGGLLAASMAGCFGLGTLYQKNIDERKTYARQGQTITQPIMQPQIKLDAPSTITMPPMFSQSTKIFEEKYLIAKPGDCYWNISKRNLKEQGITPTNNLIFNETRRILKLNDKYDINCSRKNLSAKFNPDSLYVGQRVVLSKDEMKQNNRTNNVFRFPTSILENSANEIYPWQRSPYANSPQYFTTSTMHPTNYSNSSVWRGALIASGIDLIMLGSAAAWISYNRRTNKKK